MYELWFWSEPNTSVATKYICSRRSKLQVICFCQIDTLERHIIVGGMHLSSCLPYNQQCKHVVLLNLQTGIGFRTTSRFNQVILCLVFVIATVFNVLVKANFTPPSTCISSGPLNPLNNELWVWRPTWVICTLAARKLLNKWLLPCEIYCSHIKCVI